MLMKTSSMYLYTALVFFFPKLVISAEIYVFLFHDYNSTNLVQTWCGKPLSQDRFKAKIIQAGSVSNINDFTFPIRVRPEITVEELLSVVNIFNSSGITNISVQMTASSCPKNEKDPQKMHVVVRLPEKTVEGNKVDLTD